MPHILSELFSGDPLKAFWPDYCDAVAELKDEKCRDYCGICGDNCCAGRLNPEISDPGSFSGLRKVRYRWHRPPEGDEPYLIDRRFLLWGSLFLVRACPHLKDGRCSIHGEAGRPRVCSDYPMYLQSPFSLPFLRPFISVELSCTIFRYRQNCDEVRRFAQKKGLDVVFHPAR